MTTSLSEGVKSGRATCANIHYHVWNAEALNLLSIYLLGY